MANEEARFWAKVRKTDTCWLWMGHVRSDGYGPFWANNRWTYAHRFAWEQVNGPIPDGLEIDHKCRNRACVRPSHLEAVTHAENMRRGEKGDRGRKMANKTHCPQGHPYSGDNLYIIPSTGGRTCRICRHEEKFRYRARKRAMRETVVS